MINEITKMGGSLFMVGLALFFFVPFAIIVAMIIGSTGNGTVVLYLIGWLLLMFIGSRVRE